MHRRGRTLTFMRMRRFASSRSAADSSGCASAGEPTSLNRRVEAALCGASCVYVSAPHRALSVTQRALSVTQRALSVTQRALSVTQRAS
jgi:hypothetical protein